MVSTPAKRSAKSRRPRSHDIIGPDTAHSALQRVALESPAPDVDGGRFPVKRVVGDVIAAEIDMYADGHDRVAGVLCWRAPDTDTHGDGWHETRLQLIDNDRWGAAIELTTIGDWSMTFAGWVDSWGTWRHDLDARVAAGQELDVDLQIGAELIRGAARRAQPADRTTLTRAAKTLHAGGQQGLATALDADLDSLMQQHPDRTHESAFDRAIHVDVERERARFSAWYERFPRSTADAAGEHGTFATLQAELPRIAAMGFDVLYLPPIHPIGRDHRKGPNNAVAAGTDDPGSPWAIGSADGGHTEIHPQLGTLADFSALREAASIHGLELALDLAYQCAPDHPWVAEHPTWFRQRPDGTVQYAENPPKKYQDIYPIDFASDDWQPLWLALKDVVDTWIARGVHIFRVDNPHTKAFPFWEWMIAAVRAEHPDVIFLAEAFTRPKVMYRLAKLGFSQSYTYFTWRYDRAEFEQYLTELTSPPVVDFMRPNFWPNTPDILTEQLQHGTRSTFVSRLVLAATMSASYGIYGPSFELCEASPARAGSEEYLDSEKYEVRHRDLSKAQSMEQLIARINQARREHPALHRNDTLRFHHVDNDRLIAWSKSTPDCGDVMLMIVNLDEQYKQAGTLHLDLAALGIDQADGIFDVHDLLDGSTYEWRGSANYIELDPKMLPAHILHVRPRATRDEHDFVTYA